MAQLVPPNANAFAKWSIIGGLVFVVALIWVMAAYARIANHRVGVPIEQPVAFSRSASNLKCNTYRKVMCCDGNELRAPEH